MAKLSSYRSLSCAVWRKLLPHFILLSLLLFPSLSLSQAPVPTPVGTLPATLPPATLPPATLAPAPTPTPPRPTTLLTTTRIPDPASEDLDNFATSVDGPNPTSASAPTSTKQIPTTNTEGANSGEGENKGNERTSASALQYYFAFLALFVICLFIFIYIVHRRTKQKKARCRNSVQNALSRDVDGWTGARRWIGGSWRGEGISGDEGLNELGEAPPPYKSRHLSGDGPGRVRYSQQRDSGLAIPLRPLSSGDTDGMKPPLYRRSNGASQMGTLPTLSRQHTQLPSPEIPSSLTSPVYQVGRITSRRSSA